jgi:hypothetical protein
VLCIKKHTTGGDVFEALPSPAGEEGRQRGGARLLLSRGCMRAVCSAKIGDINNVCVCVCVMGVTAVMTVTAMGSNSASFGSASFRQSGENER